MPRPRLMRSPEQPVEQLLPIRAHCETCPVREQRGQRGPQSHSDSLPLRLVGPAVATLRIALAGCFIDPNMPVLAWFCRQCGRKQLLTVRDLHLVA